MEDRSTIDRSLLRELDRHLREPREDHQASGPAISASSSLSRVDIAGALEAVQLTASSLIAMAERIRELEAHCDAFEHSNGEVETQNRTLATQLEEIARHRDQLSASLKAEHERVEQLETLTAEHVAHAGRLDRHLGEARADLAAVIEAVSNSLGGVRELGVVL